MRLIQKRQLPYLAWFLTGLLCCVLLSVANPNQELARATSMPSIANPSVVVPTFDPQELQSPLLSSGC